mgnify:CR=1 FL=1
MATGKRMHKPLWVNGPLDGDGSVTIATPAGSKQACTVGQHFGSLTLDSPTEKVSLSDLTVMKCTSDGMTLAYASAAAQPATKATKTRSNIQNN